MTSRARVHAALDRKEPDRVPICFGGTPGSGIEECPPDDRAATNLYASIGLADAEPIRVFPVCNIVSNIEARCLERLHSDMRLVSDNPPGPIAVDGEHKVWPYYYGGRITKCGIYDQIDLTHPPMAHMITGNDIDEYPHWPDARVDIMQGVVENAKKLHEESEYFICGAQSSGQFPLNGYGLLSGMDKWLMDMKIRPKFYHQLCERFMEYNLRRADVFYGSVGKYLDAAVVYDDLGHQTGPLMSLADYREFYKPYQSETIKHVRKYLRPEAKIILKSGGSIHQFIPDLIEIGVDVLSPVQPLADKMEPWRLKNEYGSEVSFLGGFDVQSLLPFGRKDDIERGVRLLLSEYAKGGGYVFGASYVIQSNTPPENIVAMFDAAHDHGSYPIADHVDPNTFVEFVRGLDLQL